MSLYVHPVQGVLNILPVSAQFCVHTPFIIVNCLDYGDLNYKETTQSSTTPLHLIRKRSHSNSGHCTTPMQDDQSCLAQIPSRFNEHPEGNLPRFNEYLNDLNDLDAYLGSMNTLMAAYQKFATLLSSIVFVPIAAPSENVI